MPKYLQEKTIEQNLMIDKKHQKWIRRKFPIFFSMKVNFQEQFTPPELDSLENQLLEKKEDISKQSKMTLKKLKKLANQTQKQFKSNKLLYQVLTAVEPSELRQITLMHKKLQSLKPLENAKFPKLTDIQLSYNSIENMQPLISCQLPSLTFFNLSQNKVTSLKGLQLCTWNKLKILNLSINQITSIQPLTHGQFLSLQRLDISDNKITNISGFHKINSRQIKNINFKDNRIKQMKNLPRIYFKKISDLNIKNNPICDAELVQKIQPTVIRNKNVNNQLKNSEPNVKNFLTYSYKFFYSKLIYSKSDDLFFLLLEEQNKTKNSTVSSKHFRLAAIDQYKEPQQRVIIMPAKKIHFS